MEIGPVAGIRVTTVPKARPVDPELTALFDIEAPAKPGDDTYTGSRRKAAGAEEAGDEPEQPEEILDEDLPSESAIARRDDGLHDRLHAQISFFA